MKKKIIELFWKCRAWYITTFACLLSLLNLILRSRTIQLEVWIILILGIVKLILDILHTLDEACDERNKEICCELEWMRLPTKVEEEIKKLDLDENIENKIIDVIWSETKKTIDAVEEIRNGDIYE